jgi:tetratricopeptide (TPR) repeat protein
MTCPDENVLAAFTDGALAGEEASAVRAHVEACAVCRAVLEQLGAAAAQVTPAGEGREPTLGTRVGRFLVLHPVGAGGMGVVYAAYDPELDRKVALKLLRAGRGKRGEAQRLLREAQAIARLSHPHVVSLFDVGAWGEEVFLAMEFVEGGTLTQWLQAGRPRREVLKAFVAAGEGLAAAHRAGLVHRDFKPDNVLVGEDGRVRVTDFGLARQASDLALEGDSLAAEAPTGLLANTLTGTGALVGTPAYMAPEQHAGQAAEARSDQFSFCVALWEALYGERPFAGRSPTELSEAKREGRVRPARREARVPERLRRLLLRGLSPRAEERFASMEALLEGLRRETANPRRRWALAGATLAGALLALAGLGATGARARLMCRGTVEDLAGTWDGARRETMRKAFDATGLPYAQAAFERSARVLDEYARAWAGARAEACEATHVRGEQSEALLDARMQCLHERRLALRSTTELLASADKALVERAIQAAQALPRVEGCAALQALSGVVPPPQEPEARQRLEATQAEVARALALRNAGRYAEALKVARDAVASADALGHAPLQADALIEQSASHIALRQNAEAEDALHRAFQRAQVGRHDVAATRAAMNLTLVLGMNLRQHAQAHRWGALAQALNERTGGDPLTESNRLTHLGAVLFDEGRQEEALAHYTRALALRRQHVGTEDATVAQLYNNIGNSLIQLGRYDEAHAEHRKALAIRERELGPDHPLVATSLSNLGIGLMRQGKAAEAVPLTERALAIQERALGPDSFYVGMTVEALGLVYWRAGRMAEGAKLLERSATIYEKLQGPEAPALARVYSNMGGLRIEQKDFQGALEPLRRSMVITEKLLGPGHPDLAEALSKLALAYLGLGRPQEALEPLERVHRMLASKDNASYGYGHEMRITVHLSLGRALWALGRERARARTLVQTALELGRASPDTDVRRSLVAEAEQWLATH